MLHGRVAFIIHVYVIHRSLYIASYLFHNAQVGVSKKPPQGNALSGAFEGRVYRCTLGHKEVSTSTVVFVKTGSATADNKDNRPT